jgi:hypothetical protein
MGYQHIPNLDKDPRILQFRRVYATEKIHGTSAHISWSFGLVGNAEPLGVLKFFAGGCDHERFVALFDAEQLATAFKTLGQDSVTIYGEAYGGKLQGMSKTYGDKLRFIAFEVKIGESWLAVPQAAEVVAALGLEFVHYEEVSTDIETLDALRHAPSVQSVRNGVEHPMTCREGIVLRPPFEVKVNNGERVMAKFKADWARETATPRKVGEVTTEVADADKLAAEWVTPMRITHVLDKFGEVRLDRTPEFIKAVWEDVLRESAGEVADTKPNRRAVSHLAVTFYKEQNQTLARARLEEATQC